MVHANPFRGRYCSLSRRFHLAVVAKPSITTARSCNFAGAYDKQESQKIVTIFLGNSGHAHSGGCGNKSELQRRGPKPSEKCAYTRIVTVQGLNGFFGGSVNFACRI